MQNKTYDVAILGTGFAGTSLAAILARHEVSVLLIDAGTHPRFAIGESTISYTSMLMEVISIRYDLPEFMHLASFRNVQKYVSSSSGLKRNFGFVYHREGKNQDPTEVNQFVIPKTLFYENHLFRQDIDAYLLHIAMRYGASACQRTKIAEIDIDDARVRLVAEDGRTFNARYLVDASGYGSPVARKFGLREDPPRFKHHARSLFTHMINVKPYDDVAPRPPSKRFRNPVPWCQGTLHHLFDGGWIWVIPFNNHRNATNPLISVGLTVDPRVHPRQEGVSPQEEFDSFVSRFPEIEKQFADARSVREWVSTGDRMQYSSRRVVGNRFCLASHAAGFVDPLYSRGLTNTLEVTNALAGRLIDAVREDDFSVDRFDYIENLQQGILDLNDSLVYSSYASFKDFRLWNAAFRVWALTNVVGTFTLQATASKFKKSRDPSVFDNPESSMHVGHQIPNFEGYTLLLRDTEAIVDKVADGQSEPGEAAEKIFGLLKEADFLPPLFAYADPDTLFYHPTPDKVVRTVMWAHLSAPKEVGEIIGSAMNAFAMRKLAGG